VLQDELGYHRYKIGDGKDHLRHRVCTRCGTECGIRLGRGTGNVEVEGLRQNWFSPAWTITATTYYNIGTCRDPRDPKWLAAFYGIERQYKIAWSTLEALWNGSPA